MSFEQAFPEHAREGREALARSMCRFLPIMAAEAKRDGAGDEWVWRQMSALAEWLAHDGEPPAPDELAANAAHAIVSAATRMAAAGVGHAPEWTQILALARTIAEATP